MGRPVESLRERLTVKTLEFEDDYTWVDSLLSIVFHVDVDDRRIECRVSQKTLNDYYRTTDSKEQAIVNFVEHRKTIVDIVSRMITLDDFDDEGNILITNAVCRRYNF